jgi:hypothetical protein
MGGEGVGDALGGCSEMRVEGVDGWVVDRVEEGGAG